MSEISLREYFAGKAMQAIIIKEGVPSDYHWDYGTKDGKPDLAKKSFDIADAMIKQLKQKLNKLLCYIFGHQINVYSLELSREKECLRCDKKINVPFLVTPYDHD